MADSVRSKCAQAGFQSQAGQLAGVEDGGHVANLRQGFIEGVDERCALRVQCLRRAALKPVTLHFCRREHLADVIVQLAAQTMPLGFLNLQHVLGQFPGLKLNGPVRAGQAVAEAGKRQPVDKRQPQRQRAARQIRDHIAARGRQAEQGCPANHAAGVHPMNAT